MQETLLATKLHIPRAPRELVSRSRLVEQLNAGLPRKLTLVSAPAGFGKSTLLSAWVTTCDRPVAWLSVDEGDKDPARFLAYVIAALQTIEPRIGEGVWGLLQASRPPAIESVLTVVLNDLATISDKAVLVLDDFHLLDARPIDDALTFLLDHLPEQLHLVIATREDPRLPLARLRARNQLTELRVADLRFTSSEVADFLNEVMGLGLSPEDITALGSRTEGWITGLQLAALSLQGSVDVTGFIQSFTGSHRFVLDYLVEEVLYHQPKSVSTFLLQTSILNRLTGPLCDALTGETNGRAMLELLERINLFVVSLDEERSWYRYHQLFADLLRQRLQQAQPDRVTLLHTTASRWYEKKGLTHEAMAHALSARDFERAADLMVQLASNLGERGGQHAWLRWLEALPEDVVRARPMLSVYHGWVLTVAGQLREAEQRIRAVEGVQLSTENDDQPRDDDMRGMIAAVRTYLARSQGDLPATIRFADEALTELPVQNTVWRGAVTALRGDALALKGRTVEANQAYTDAATTGHRTGNFTLFLLASTNQAYCQRLLGQLRQASRTCRRALKVTAEHGLARSPMASGVLAMLAQVLCDQGALDDAQDAAREAVTVSKSGDRVAAIGLACLALLRVLFLRNELADADEIIRELEGLAREDRLPPWTRSRAMAWKARVFIARGELSAASALQQERGLNADDHYVFYRHEEYLARARLLLTQRQLTEATALLSRLVDHEGEAGRVTNVIEILCMLSLVHHARQNTDDALDSLARALSLAEPEGHIQVFIDLGDPMAHLLHEAIRRGIAPTFARRLLEVSAPGDSESEKGAPNIEASPSLIEPLTTRELEVLQLIAQGLSNREIGERLFLAVSTVKGHNRNIFSKLEVQRRTEAVARARELGLI